MDDNNEAGLQDSGPKKEGTEGVPGGYPHYDREPTRMEERRFPDGGGDTRHTTRS